MVARGVINHLTILVFLAVVVACGSDEVDSVAPTIALQWQDVLDAGGGDQAIAVDTCGGRVFVTGYIGSTALRTSDFVVRAYDAHRGRRLWEHVVDRPGFGGFGAAIDCDNDVVFVGEDFEATQVLRAYDAEDGAVLWEKDLTREGGSGRFLSIVVHDQIVFALVRSFLHVRSDQLLTYALDEQTSQVLWEHRAVSTNGARGELSVSAMHVCMRRSSVDEGTDHSLLCLDRSSGEVAWEASLGTSDDYFVLRPPILSADGSTLAVLGNDGHRVFVRAYDAATGTDVWDVNYRPRTVLSDLEAHDDTFFVVGWEFRDANPLQHVAALVDALDVGSGSRTWKQRHPGEWEASAALTSDGLAVVGQNWQIRIYSRRDGSILVETPGKAKPPPSRLYGLATDDSLLFLAGGLTEPKDKFSVDYAVRAYRATGSE